MCKNANLYSGRYIFHGPGLDGFLQEDTVCLGQLRERHNHSDLMSYADTTTNTNYDE